MTLEYEPHSPAFLEDPWEFYRMLRDHHPVYRDPRSGSYLISRFEDVWAVTNDWPLFRSGSPSGSRNHFASMDPPRHDEHRQKVAHLFTPSANRRRAAEVQSMCQSLVAPLSARASFDAVTDFAAHLPNMVISRIVGLPDTLAEEFRLKSLALAEVTDTPDYLQAVWELEEVARAAVGERGNLAAGGVMEVLANDATPDALDGEEMVGLVTNLVLAGTDTVTNLIGSGIVLLDRRPELVDRLASDDDLWSRLIEELLRFESPVQVLWRHTSAHTVLHGISIPAEAEIRLLWGAANRDDREFEDPDRFVCDRKIRRHLGFGHGIHFCLGAALARLEARSALQALLPLLHRFRVDDGELVRLRSATFRGYERVPLVRRFVSA
jgi:cytochrome P450 family 130